MKQILQNLGTGKTELIEIPCPILRNGHLLIRTHTSLVSSGTERMLIDFAKANYIDKARQQPDKVKQVLTKITTDGLLPTIDGVCSKLDQPLPLGYCNAGVVLESGTEGFETGDRVASNGYHSEVVCVQQNLCARIPAEVDDETASFTVLGAIGLQGIRLVKPTLGEAVVVSGLGLVGLLTVQMLRANGCRVLGIDFNSSRCALAQQFGAEIVDLSKGEDPVAVAQSFSRGRGVDAVIVAAASKSDEVMHQAAQMCRKRGRIVLIGVVGLNLRRDDFFKKEISFQVSSSYGPGRYDPSYEEKGQDYPVGFVRWTEQRNFEAVLDMMASGSLDIKPLISHRFTIDEAINAYEMLSNPSALGIVLDYPQKEIQELRNPVVTLQPEKSNHLSGVPVVGFIGAGNYASRILIPAFKKAGVAFESLITQSGINGVHHGKKAGFSTASTELNTLWDSNTINTVIIATRHDAHAGQVISALESGKNVFIEKPLALRLEELDAIDEAYKKAHKKRDEPLRLMVGFNRRFAPHIVKMKSLIERKHEPKTIIITVNSGAISDEHWTQNHEVGGGRIIGEGCHFIDLMRFLIGHPITSYQAVQMGASPCVKIRDDKVSITLSFSDGSFGSIHYLANGGKTFPKERVEVFCGDGVLQMNNYRILQGYSWPVFKKMKLFSQDKGQKACVKAFVDSIRDGRASPIPYEELMEVSRVTIEIAKLLQR